MAICTALAFHINRVIKESSKAFQAEAHIIYKGMAVIIN